MRVNEIKLKLVALLMFVALLTLMFFTVNVISVSATDSVKSGTTGDCVWTLDGTVLTISGKGKMEDYSGSYFGDTSSPWDKTITKVIIEKGVTNIGEWAFAHCGYIESVSISDSVTSIGDNAFWKCNNLKKVTIPDSVTSIGYEAFYYCLNLAEVTIGKGVTDIGYGSFRCSALSSIYIPDNVTVIKGTAFADTTNLTSITIGVGVESVETAAFLSCYNLKDVYYTGDEVTGSKIYFSAQNTDLNDATWHYNSCIGTTEHTYDNNCDEECNGCFNEREITHSYDNECDEQCNLCGFVRTDGCHLYDNDYDNKCNLCGSIRTISGITGDCIWTFDGSVLTISGNGAMEDFSYSSKAPWSVFSDDIVSVVIEDGVTNIGNYAFENCFNLRNVTIGNDVTYIGNYAFETCVSLGQIRIPDSVVSIGSSAFTMTSLYGIYIPKSVSYIDDRAFSLCFNLTVIEVDKDNQSYSSDSKGVLFDKNKTILIKAPCSIFGDYVISDTVNTIGNEAFYSCRDLSSVTIPTSVTRICYSAFESCDNLKDVYYLGDEADQEKISIEQLNKVLTDATWHYNSCIATTEHSCIWVIDKENTCGDEGVKHEECTVCDAVLSENTVIEATGNHTCIWVIDKENTCGDEGIKHEECIVCDAVLSENTVIEATGNHSFIWVTDKENSCGDQGVKHKECTVCDAVRNENTVIEATGNHIYTNVCDPDCNVCTLTREVGPHFVSSGEYYILKNSNTYPFLLSEGWYTSTNKTDNSSSTFTLTATDIVTLEIWYRVSSEERYDELVIAKNSVVLVIASGNVPDTLLSVTLSEGDVITFSYTKDVSLSNGTDSASFKISPCYVNAEDIDPDCKTPVICSGCGIIVKPVSEEHTYDNSCDTDCNICGFVRTVSDHSYTLNSNHTCDICKYSKTPDAPIIESKTNNSITLIPWDGFEYSKDGSIWQTGNVFTNLSADTTYTFYQRVRACDTAFVSGTSRGTIVTFKSAQEPPSSPRVHSYTDTTVTLVAAANCEYSVDGITWQISNVFSGLSAATQYTFYQRYAETETHEASNKSAGTGITTDKSKQTLVPDAPVVQSFTSNSITLVPVDGCEYSKNGSTWQSSNVFNYLYCATEYKFYQRYKETSTTYVGKSSEVLVAKTDKGTQSKPSIPTLFDKTYNSVTLYAISGYEYSCDGVNWQTSNVFTGLDAETNYMFYQRRAETDSYYASASSNVLIVKTGEPPICTINPELHSYENDCDSVCDECGYVRQTSGHKYDNACDAMCNACGHTRPITHNYIWVVDKENSCGNSGLKHEECTVCDGKRNENTVINATGNHSMGAWSVYTEAKFHTDGEERKHCSVCDYYESRVIPKLSESHVCEFTGQEEIVSKATCTEDGSKKVYCYELECGKSELKTIETTGHTEGEWTVTKSETCTEDGVKEQRCTVCKELIKAETISATGHSMSAWSVYTEAKFHTDGEERKHCSVCDYYESRVIPKLSESHVCEFTGQEEIVSKATCTEDGSKKVYCYEPECGKSELKTIEATGHTEGEWIVAKAATCTEDGAKEQKCTVCDILLTSETISAIGHTEGEWTVTRSATCTENGTKEQSCSVCHEVINTEEIPFTGHQYSDWIIAKEPTATESGEESRECGVCHEVETKVIDPTSVKGILGDVNGDGKVNIKDATLIQKSIANLTELTETGEALADADLNTKINIKDATAIQKHIAGMETGYPIGKPKTK